MNVNDYGKFTEDIWFSKHRPDCEFFCRGRCDCDQNPERSLSIMAMGLAGEVGEVMEILKKRVRDGKFDLEKLEKELGDVGYYWARICMHFGLMPGDVLGANMSKLLGRKARGTMQGSGDDR